MEKRIKAWTSPFSIQKVEKCIKAWTSPFSHVYQNALLIELQKAGLQAEKEKGIQVHYDNQVVGDYIADLVVENKIILELKSIKELHPAHEAQLVNYLKATGIEVGLLINFGDSVQIKRKIFTPKDLSA